MAEVEFNFKSKKIIIQCNINDKMNDIYNKYMEKLGKNINDIYFVYNGIIINENKKDIKFNELANNIDKERKKINILVYEKYKKIKR